MKLRDIALTSGIAGLTMTGTLLSLSPAVVDAVGEGGKPGIVVDGVTFTVETADASSLPTARITAVNTTDETVQIDGTVRLMAQNLASFDSRMGPTSREAWSSPELFVLGPRETKTFLVQSQKPLPSRTLGRFILRAGKEAVGTAQFRPAVAKADAALAKAKVDKRKPKRSGKRGRPVLARVNR